MKIKGATVIGIGVASFLGGVAAGVAACRKDCLKAAGQFFGGVATGAAAVGAAVVSAHVQKSEDSMAEREWVARYIRLREAQAEAAMLDRVWLGLTPGERLYVRTRYGF